MQSIVPYVYMSKCEGLISVLFIGWGGTNVLRFDGPTLFHGSLENKGRDPKKSWIQVPIHPHLHKMGHPNVLLHLRPHWMLFWELAAKIYAKLPSLYFAAKV